MTHRVCDNPQCRYYPVYTESARTVVTEGEPPKWSATFARPTRAVFREVLLESHEYCRQYTRATRQDGSHGFYTVAWLCGTCHAAVQLVRSHGGDV